MTDRAELNAILLAAGPSSRLGQPKQLVEYEGATLVRRAATLLTGLVTGPVIAVTGFEWERVAAELVDLPVEPVVNSEWALGMGGSISCGARVLPEFSPGVLVMVCDQWLLSKADLGKLIEAWRAAPDQIHVASWKEGGALVSGPPVIFPGRLKGYLKGVDKSRGARQVIDRFIDIARFVEIESASCDLDRPEDLERLLRDD